MKSALDSLIEELETTIRPVVLRPSHPEVSAYRPGIISPRAPLDSPRTAKSEERKCNGLAACGSPHCAGCYDVALGVRIHPPKCGEDYRAWLERWEAKGKLQ
jgi:hypothetical protein